MGLKSITFSRLLYALRKWITVTIAAVAVPIAWGSVTVVIARLLTPISEEQALLFIGLPISVAIAIFVWPRLPEFLGFTKNDAH